MLFFSHEPGSSEWSGPRAFMWALIYLGLGVPGAWKLWYRSMYYAVRDNSNTKFAWFFVTFILHSGFACIAAAGIPGMCTAGVLQAITIFTWTGASEKTYIAEAVVCCINAAMWVTVALWSVSLLRRMKMKYQDHGAAGAQQIKKAATRRALAAGMNAAAENKDLFKDSN